MISNTNLHQQYLDCKTEIDAAIARTIATSSFITGPDVNAFERDFARHFGAEDCAESQNGRVIAVHEGRPLSNSKTIGQGIGSQRRD